LDILIIYIIFLSVKNKITKIIRGLPSLQKEERGKGNLVLNLNQKKPPKNQKSQHHFRSNKFVNLPKL